MIDAADAQQRTIKRNRIVLILLLAFVSLAFAINLYHVTREMRGPALQQQGLTSPASTFVRHASA
ncbi:MAG: hypothetical protein GY844_05690 [Bradyrhizobium sp.]|nr:hypothetical protein [Bosea sp. AS-1]MCP4615909.1 hypothetical protein [Bradyrhizobium sp.]MCP4732755.1 hypothetical protein [Bosea sp. (in: a-proteobacteria)]